MKKYRVMVDVTRVEGTQCFIVEANSEEEAAELFKQGEGEVEEEELEVQGFGEPYGFEIVEDSEQPGGEKEPKDRSFYLQEKIEMQKRILGGALLDNEELRIDISNAQKTNTRQRHALDTIAALVFYSKCETESDCGDCTICQIKKELREIG